MQKRSFGFLILVTTLAFSNAAMAQTVTVPAPVNVAPGNTLPPAVSTNDPRPPVPSPVVGRKLTLVHQAGIGGPTSYARGGVLELGGHLSFLNGTNYTNLSVTPSVGFFVANNFELSVLTSVAYTRSQNPVAGKRTLHNVNVVAVLEPSFHLPLADHLFAFAGLGVGVAYQQGAGAGFALAPRVGMDIMVGRSGVLTPAFNLNWSTNSASSVRDRNGIDTQLVAVRTLIGASVGYKVMF